ncbi:hypothetical protein FRB94_012043 [Tulasnella sp. JGI-2019a]|nr:hypothetical protein FRB94_012043 [Tulasnella sp. JGI-2019a]
MAIRRVTHNPLPPLLTSVANPRFLHSFRLLQFLRDRHSDSESAEALETWTAHLSQVLKVLKTSGRGHYEEQDIMRWSQMVNDLMARSSAYQTLFVVAIDCALRVSLMVVGTNHRNLITAKNINTLNDVSDADLEHFIMMNAKIRSRLQRLMKAAAKMDPNDKGFESSLHPRSRLMVALRSYERRAAATASAKKTWEVVPKGILR